MKNQSVKNPQNGSAKVAEPVAAAFLAGFQPAQGLPGTYVNLNGSGLCDAQYVLIGGVPAADMKVISDNQIGFSVPDGAYTGPVTVILAGQEPLVSAAPFSVTSSLQMESAFRTLTTSETEPMDDNLIIRGGGIILEDPPILIDPPIITGPSVTGYSTFSASPGLPITIFGSGFTTVTGVRFGFSAPVPANSFSGSTVNVTVPFTAQSGNITVFFSNGTFASGPFFSVLSMPVDLPPAPVSITGYSVTQATPGNPITIFGSGFTAVSSVRFNGALPVPASSFGPSAINVTVPSNATSGTVTVNFSNGTTAIGPFLQTVAGLGPPFVTGYSVDFTFRGDLLTIFGSNFPVGRSVSVTFTGGAQSFGTITAPQAFTVPVPQNALTGPITVRVPTDPRPITGPQLFVFSNTIACTGYAPQIAKRTRPLKITGGNFSQLSQVAFAGITGPVFVEGFNFDFFNPDNVVSVNIPGGAFSGGRVRLFFQDGSIVDGPPLTIQNF